MGISDYEKTIKYLVLSMMKGIGTVTQNALLDVCGSIDQCFSVDAEEFLCRDMDDRLGRSRIRQFVSRRNDKELWSQAESTLEMAHRKGIDVILRDAEEFPQRFGGISDMPILLYTKGEMRINECAVSTGIVGARRCTREDKKNCISRVERLAEERSGVIIISGGAKGIDGYAHTAAVKNGLRTIAFIGTGPDLCYPKEHAGLFDQICEHGMILSEYPPGTGAEPYHFPRRNRLIAGWSDEMYIIAAGRNSGTNTTRQYFEKYHGGRFRSCC